MRVQPENVLAGAAKKVLTVPYLQGRIAIRPYMFYKKVITVECMGMTDRKILGDPVNLKKKFIKKE